MSNQIFNKKEAREILNISRSKQWRLEKSRQIKPTCFIGRSARYSVDDLAKAMQKEKTSRR